MSKGCNCPFFGILRELRDKLEDAHSEIKALRKELEQPKRDIANALARIGALEKGVAKIAEEAKRQEEERVKMKAEMEAEMRKMKAETKKMKDEMEAEMKKMKAEIEKIRNAPSAVIINLNCGYPYKGACMSP